MEYKGRILKSLTLHSRKVTSVVYGNLLPAFLNFDSAFLNFDFDVLFLMLEAELILVIFTKCVSSKDILGLYLLLWLLHDRLMLLFLLRGLTLSR